MGNKYTLGQVLIWSSQTLISYTVFHICCSVQWPLARRQAHFEISFISKLHGKLKLCEDVSNPHKQNKDHIWAKLISFSSILAVHSIYYRYCYNEQSVPRETIRFPKPDIWNTLHSFLVLTDTFRAFVQQRVHSWEGWRVKQKCFPRSPSFLSWTNLTLKQNNFTEEA